jgi:hypothetical protein
VYNYDSTNYFTTKLNISNVNTVFADIGNMTRMDVADYNSNVYLGTGSGNAITALRNCFQNTAVGYNAGSTISNCSNVVALGYNSGYGATNTVRSIFIGYSAGTSSYGCANNIVIDPSGGVLASSSTSNTIAIGARVGTQSSHGIFLGTNSGYGTTGTYNIVVGHYAGSTTVMTGSNNIIIGNGVKMGATCNSTIYIGNQSNIPIAAETVSNSVAIGKSDTGMYYIGTTSRVPGLMMDVSGYARIANGLAIGRDPLQYTLDVNGTVRATDGYGTMTMYHDASGNGRFYESGTVQAAQGIFSVQGLSLIGYGAVTFGALRYGRNDIMIVSSASGSWESCSYMWFGSGSPIVLSLSNSEGAKYYSVSNYGSAGSSPQPIVAFSTSNMQTPATGQPWYYTITYFPLPAAGTYAVGTSSGPS